MTDNEQTLDEYIDRAGHYPNYCSLILGGCECKAKEAMMYMDDDRYWRCMDCGVVLFSEDDRDDR